MSHSFPMSTVVARKATQCTWCSQSIAPGETYLRWVYVDDNYFTNKMHPECREARNPIHDNVLARLE